MKLLTFQNPIVLDILIKNKVYECNFISELHKSAPDCYKRLAKDLQKIAKIPCTIPIFAWHTVIPGKPISISDIKRMDEMVSIKKGNIGLEIDVPDQFVLLQGFYNFVDALYNEKCDELEWDPWEHVYSFNACNNEVQAIIPYIRGEWVTAIYLNLQEDDDFILTPSSKQHLVHCKKDKMENVWLYDTQDELLSMIR